MIEPLGLEHERTGSDVKARLRIDSRRLVIFIVRRHSCVAVLGMRISTIYKSQLKKIKPSSVSEPILPKAKTRQQSSLT